MRTIYRKKKLKLPSVAAVPETLLTFIVPVYVVPSFSVYGSVWAKVISTEFVLTTPVHVFPFKKMVTVYSSSMPLVARVRVLSALAFFGNLSSNLVYNAAVCFKSAKPLFSFSTTKTS